MTQSFKSSLLSVLTKQICLFKNYMKLREYLIPFFIYMRYNNFMEVFVDNKTIELRKDEEFITLGTLLKIAGLIQTGGMAKVFLANNNVYVNGEAENRRGRKLYRGAEIRVANKTFSII